MQANSNKQEAFNALENLIHQISENCFVAAWYVDIEFIVWHAIHGDRSLGNEMHEDKSLGDAYVSEGEADQLLQLSRKIDGWTYWDDSIQGTRYVSLSEWRRLYVDWLADTGR